MLIDDGEDEKVEEIVNTYEKNVEVGGRQANRNTKYKRKYQIHEKILDT